MISLISVFFTLFTKEQNSFFTSMKKIGRTENLLSKKRRQKYPAFFELKLPILACGSKNVRCQRGVGDVGCKMCDVNEDSTT